MLDILYYDQDVVAIDKPAGMLVHRSRIDIRATQFAVQCLRQQIGRPVFLIHRLDRPTSGVLLFALSPSSAKRIASQFESGRVKKTYRAIVRGFTAPHQRWVEPLVEKPDRMTDSLARKDKPPQNAITEFNTIRRWEIPFSAGKYQSSRYSEVAIIPLTGRRHQIRRHFNHMAHPVIGDTTHGDRRHNRLFRERLELRRLMLVAHRLEFMHPSSNQPITVTASLDGGYQAAIQKLTTLDVH